MESAIANVDLGRYRRIVQMFWDPEPVNDMSLNQPVWCLGCVYSLSEKDNRVQRLEAQEKGQVAQPDTPHEHTVSDISEERAETTTVVNSNYLHATESNSFSESLSSLLACDEERAPGAGWPPAFLQDFDARFWMTYRSNFDMIAKSMSLQAATALSLSMRIRSQLVDQNGFTSDSGWGCMIRSGQSLLCNAMAILNLGRGRPPFPNYI